VRFNANSLNQKYKQDNFTLSAATTSTQVTKIDHEEAQGNYDVLLDKLNTVVTRDG
jgi:hypothetical protein